MMSYTTSAAWSRSVLLLCCTEHDPYRGAVLSYRSAALNMPRTVVPSYRVVSPL
jgi:hypothetical protein